MMDPEEFVNAKIGEVDQKTIDRVKFTDIQLAIIKVIDDRYRVMSKHYKENFSNMSDKQKICFGNWFHEALDFYSIFVNKFVTNDGFLMFRVGELVDATPESVAGGKRGGTKW
jgi:hypothetical protein